MEANPDEVPDGDLYPDGGDHIGQPVNGVPKREPGELCNARRSRDGTFIGYCRNVAGKGTDHTGDGRCEFHGGKSSGPRNPSTLEGNDHARGNPGGGAPELNGNAARANYAFADHEKLLARLDIDELHEVATLEWCVLQEAREHAPEVDPERRRELAHEYGILSRQWELATVDTFDRGFLLEREVSFEADGETHTYTNLVANPTWGRSLTLSSRQREIAKELKLWPGFQD